MKIEIQTDEEHEERLAQRKNVDYTSKAAKLKLFGLIGLLLVVLFMMQEAGKPERWAWMGFGNQPQPNVVSNSEAAVPPTKQDENPEVENVQEETIGDGEITQSSPDNDNDAANVNSDVIVLNDAESDAIPKMTADFWRELYHGLRQEQQRELFRVTRAVRTATKVYRPAVDSENPMASAPAADVLEALMKRIAREHELYQRKGLERLTLQQDNSPEMQRLSEGLSQTKEFWETKIQPAMSAAIAGEDFTISQQRAVVQLQNQVLDDLAMSEVLDKSSAGRTKDANAWLRTWERALDPANSFADAKPVKHIQLSSQPEIYRGQPVKILGHIRSAQKTVLENHEVGLPEYYVLWIKPDDSSVSPYCVYVSELPAEFPTVTETYLEMNERVEINGLFFKLRTHVAKDTTVVHSPLILANTVVWNPRIPETAAQAWNPPDWSIWISFILMPLFATWIAWRIYNSTMTLRPAPHQSTQSRINDSLEELADDPTIQSDLERVKSLTENLGQ